MSWIAVEAIGTWVGALGGTAAVLAAVLTYWSGEAKREDDRALAREARNRAEEDAKNRASRVTVRWYVAVSHAQGPEIAAQVHNRNTEYTAHDVRVECPDVGRLLRTRPLGPGVELPTGAVGVPRPQDQDERAWMAALRERTKLTYLINDVEWVRVGSNPPERTGN